MIRFLHNCETYYNLYLFSQDEPYKCLVCARSFAESEQMRAHLLTHNGVHNGPSPLLSFAPQAPQNIRNRQCCPSSPPSSASNRNPSTDVMPEFYTGRVLATEVNSLERTERSTLECVDILTQSVFPLCDVLDMSDVDKRYQQSELENDGEIKCLNESEMNGNDEGIVKLKTYEHCGGQRLWR